MSEFNVEHMIDNLEQGREFDFNEKSEQIIDNFRLKRLQQLIKVYCAIKVSPPKKGLLDQLMNLADEDNLILEFNTVIHVIDETDLVLRNCFFEDMTLFERLLKTDLALPTPREFAKAYEMNYSSLQIQPGWRSNFNFIQGAIKAFEKQFGGSLELELYESFEDELETDQRPNRPYAIFLPDRTTAFYDKSRIREGYDKKEIQNWQLEHERIVHESVSSRANIQGLTISEYLFAQSINADRGKSMLDPADDGVIRWSILTGESVINKDGKLQGVGAKWEELKKQLRVVALEEGGDVPVAPWTAISFDDFGGSNE